MASTFRKVVVVVVAVVAVVVVVVVVVVVGTGREREKKNKRRAPLASAFLTGFRFTGFSALLAINKK